MKPHALILLSLTTVAHAAVTINWGNFISNSTAIVDSEANPVTGPPFIFELGYFINSGPQGSKTMWRDQWVGLDTATLNPTVGFFSSTWNDSSNAHTGEQLHIWISNGDFNSTPMSEWALLTADEWIVPQSVDQTDPVLDFRVSNNPAGPNFFPADEVIIGQLNETIGDGKNSEDKPVDSTIQLYTVPEPSSALLLLIASVTLLSRRRA